MRHPAPLLLSLLALLPQPVAAQMIPYEFGFDQPQLFPDEAPDSRAAGIGPAWSETEDATFDSASLLEDETPLAADDDNGWIDRGFDAAPDDRFAVPAVAGPANDEDGGDRFVETDHPRPEPSGGAYGPFRVMDAGHAALVGMTDERSPAAFSAMLHDYPGIARSSWSMLREPTTTTPICASAG